MKDKTIKKIIEVASSLFAKYGFRKTSMDEIARVARKAKGSLYYHFESKEELFTAVVTKEINNLRTQLSLIVSDNKLTAEMKLKDYLVRRMEILNTAANYHEALKADFFEHFDFIDNLREDMDRWEKEKLKAIMTQGVEEGVFDESNMNLEMLSDVFIMVLKGLEIPFFLQGKYEKYSAHNEGLLRILVKGLSK